MAFATGGSAALYRIDGYMERQGHYGEILQQYLKTLDMMLCLNINASSE